MFDLGAFLLNMGYLLFHDSLKFLEVCLQESHSLFGLRSQLSGLLGILLGSSPAASGIAQILADLHVAAAVACAGRHLMLSADGVTS